MYGWHGTILRVNLTSGKITKEPLSKELAHKYIGGRGLNIKLLYDEVKPGTDPLGLDNKLIFGIGPACGTIVPGSNRWTATCKSTLSNFLMDTNSGSRFSTGLKYAGYDGLIIEGKSDRPAYLLIDGDNVSIRDALHLWGKTTTETQRVLERETGTPDVRVVGIGQAGENLVKFASLISDQRAAARAGGAVMGSKKLKAIAARGNKGVKVADRKMLEKAVQETYQMHRTDDMPQRLKGHREGGIFLGLAGWAELGVFGAKNFQQGVWPEYRLKVVAPAIKRRVGYQACFSCPGPCFTGVQFVITDGPYAGVAVGDCAAPGRSYTAQIGNSDADFMLKLHALSDEYGMDEMSTGAVLSFAMECYQAGILTPSDLGGLKLEWGNIEAISELLDMIVFRRGIGDILAEGATSAAKVIGKESEKYVMAVKGEPVDFLDPRGSKILALGYAVASGGGGHNRAKVPASVSRNLIKDLIKDQAYLKRMYQFEGRELDVLREEHMGEFFKWYEDVNAFDNMLETCLFFLINTNPNSPRFLANMYNAVTGLNISPSEVLTIGERVVNLERGFNIRNGLTRKDDYLPDRFTKEPMPDGIAKGQVVNLEPMISEYYEFRGWDKNTGIPTRKKLEELGLEEVAHDIL
jgi:aldehyde:ferredoxin oxidoreductase